MDFCILGPLEVLDDGRPLALGGRKQRALLALLLLHVGEAVSTDRIVDELWGERPPATAAKLVQGYVAALRKLLPAGVLVTRAPGYLLGLDGAAHSLDLRRFETLVAEAKDAAPERALGLLREALALWRGPALGDVWFGGLAASEAASLNDSRLVALTQRIELELALGRHGDLVGELETLVAEHPFQEGLRAQLILALYRSGRQAEALEAYRDARRALDELGIAPSAELDRLEKAVLTHDQSLETLQPEPFRTSSPALPTGSVTLLFTDIEGSTQLQHRLGELYQEVVAEHRRLLEDAFAANRGVVVDRQTESFFVTFQRARDATLAAAAAQQALASHAWPDGVQVSVRMGIHSGDPEVADDRYVGLAVSRAARICAAGHGGQVLLSSSARALIGDDGGTTVRTLGSYRLKDFPAPEPISQLEIEGLPRRFPPLRTGAELGRRKRLRLLLAAAAVLGVAAAIIGTWAAVAEHSANLTLGPTDLGVIDPKTNKLVDAIPLGFKSSLIAAGEGYVWVVDEQGSTLVRIDPRTLKRRSFAIEAGAVPQGLAVGKGAIWLAVLRGTQRLVLKRGLQFGDQIDEIPAVGGRLALGDDAVWAIDRFNGGLARIDPDTDRSKTVAHGLLGSSIAVAPDAVWVAGPPVTKIDPVTRVQEETAIRAQPGDVGSVAVGFDAAWFATSAETLLWRIDPQSMSVTRPFPVGRGPSAVSVGEGAVWVANSRDGSVTRIDPKAPEKHKEIPTGSAPGGILATYGKVWVTSDKPRR